VVTNVQVAVGDQVSRNQSLLSVYPLAGLEVRARVPEVFQRELIGALDRGESLNAYTRDREHQFFLSRFAGLSDPAGTEAVLVMKEKSVGLRPGALLPLMLERPARERAVEVPFSALYGADSVYLMTDDQRMQRVQIERIGEAIATNGERRLLIAGDSLTPGARLITTHLPNAMTGLRVEVAGNNGESSE
jgi:hypothetical protein